MQQTLPHLGQVFPRIRRVVVYHQSTVAYLRVTACLNIVIPGDRGELHAKLYSQ